MDYVLSWRHDALRIASSLHNMRVWGGSKMERLTNKLVNFSKMGAGCEIKSKLGQKFPCFCKIGAKIIIDKRVSKFDKHRSCWHGVLLFFYKFKWSYSDHQWSNDHQLIVGYL